MPGNITRAMVEQFNANLHLKASQIVSRFLPYVDVKPMKGTTMWFDVVDNVEPETKTSRLQESVVNESKIWSKRGVHCMTGFKNDWLDEDDDIGLIIDPKFPILEVHARALAKWVDDRIILAATGKALERIESGDGGYTTREVALPNKQKMDIKTGAAAGKNTAGFNLSKLIQIQDIFGKADVDASQGFGRRCLAVTQQQLTDLANEAKAVGKLGDYAAFLAIKNGETNRYNDLTIIHSERLLKSGSKRTCFAWYEKALIYGKAQDIQGKPQDDPTRDDAIKIRSTVKGNAVRLDDTLVIEIPCAENVDFEGN